MSLPDPVRAVLAAAAQLGEVLPDVVAVGLVGSYARGAAGPASDVDLLVLTDDPAAMLDGDDWFGRFDPRAELVRRSDFGAVQERRLRLRDGLVVEVGVGRPSWAEVDPVDPGTSRVVRDGLTVLYDPAGLLAALIRAVAD